VNGSKTISRRDFIRTTAAGLFLANLRFHWPLPAWAAAAGTGIHEDGASDRYDLTIGYSPFTVDGRQGTATAINGTVPGPLIHLREGDDIALSTRIVTRAGAARIIRRAFEYAQEFTYPTVTLVEKPNVLRATGGLMRSVARQVAQEFPEIELWETNIDAQMMWLLKNPQDYGVMVTSNMFGDIVSDLAAQLVGGLGFASSGNIGDHFAVFEPTHGSAPKYAGQYKVNPIAMMLAAKLMLDWLGEKEMADTLESGIAAVIRDGDIRTYDMGGESTTLEMAEAVVEHLP